MDFTRIGQLMTLIAVSFAGCPASHADFQVVSDIRYATTPGVAANLQSLDIYRPVPPPSDPMPVVIWVHGGGWKTGDKANQMRYKPSLFTAAGYCLVSVNYRLSPEPPNNDPNRVMYPIHEQDVAAAIAWVHAHIAEYGGDAVRIALMGHSAGAHLVSLVSVDSAFLASHNVPPSVIKGTVSLDTEGYDIPSHMEREFTGIYENAFGKDPAVWKQASPVQHITAGKSIPPFLIVTRGAPARRQMSGDFAAAITKAGVQATLVEATAYSHNEVNSSIGVPGEAVVTPPLMEFFQKCLREKSSKN